MISCPKTAFFGVGARNLVTRRPPAVPTIFVGIPPSIDARRARILLIANKYFVPVRVQHSTDCDRHAMPNPSSVRGVCRAARPNPPSCRAVLRSWQRLHSASRLPSSKKSALLPRCGVRWSTTVAGAPHVQTGHSEIFFARRFRHAAVLYRFRPLSRRRALSYACARSRSARACRACTCDCVRCAMCACVRVRVAGSGDGL